MKLSTQLQEKITEVKALSEKFNTRQQNLSQHNDTVSQEFAQARIDLETAVSKLATNPSAINREAEKAARRKHAELELEVSGSQQRSSAVNGTDNAHLTQVQRETLHAVGRELKSNHDAKEGEVMQAIEDAKKAYMLALKAYHDLKLVNTQSKFYDIASEIGIRHDVAKTLEPGVSINHVPFTYRAPGFNYYGIFSDETYEAMNHGVIKKGAIRE